jgi:hypothetical protein
MGIVLEKLQHLRSFLMDRPLRLDGRVAEKLYRRDSSGSSRCILLSIATAEES